MSGNYVIHTQAHSTRDSNIIRCKCNRVHVKLHADVPFLAESHRQRTPHSFLTNPGKVTQVTNPWQCQTRVTHCCWSNLQETAISSSLSHPNCVQTYTYTVEPVLSNSDIRDMTEGRGRTLALQGSTMDSHPGRAQRLVDLSLQSNDAGSGSSEMSSFSWEIRLVQEYCDLGSLRSALKQDMFRCVARIRQNSLHLCWCGLA